MEKIKRENGKQVRAVVLVSGGLDSILAVKVLQSQGIQVYPVNYSTAYFVSQRQREETDDRVKAGGEDRLMLLEKQMGVPVHREDISEAFLPLLISPLFGFGKGINPCIDCKILMLRRAKGLMEQTGADFIATGEVVGQRPMSQFPKTLKMIEDKSGLQGRLLRPLSAKILPETIPERTGLVDREKLLDLQGRSRKTQIELAGLWGITAYGQPAGGCFLTDATYARRFKDFLIREGREAVTRRNLILLQVGRHFRIHEHLKLIIGRDQWENDFLEKEIACRWVLRIMDHPGPLAITDGRAEKRDIPFMAALTAAFSDGKKEASVRVSCVTDQGQEIVTVAPAFKSMIEKHLI
jgi:tRNA-specific 2-thiouridylase